VHVVRKFAELQNGERLPGRPKSDAGYRTVALPSVLVTVLREHLAEFPSEDPDDLIFKGSKGASLRRNNFHRSASIHRPYSSGWLVDLGLCGCGSGRVGSAGLPGFSTRGPWSLAVGGRLVR
jgi:hypothetical protein